LRRLSIYIPATTQWSDNHQLYGESGDDYRGREFKPDSRLLRRDRRDYARQPGCDQRNGGERESDGDYHLYADGDARQRYGGDSNCDGYGDGGSDAGDHELCGQPDDDQRGREREPDGGFLRRDRRDYARQPGCDQRDAGERESDGDYHLYADGDADQRYGGDADRAR
jgi:hypothetical protein